jgi:hypothetical protein
MKLITRQSKVKPAIELFFKNYPHYANKYGPFYTPERYNAVKALGDNPTADEVAEVLNFSWVQCICNECNKECESVVQVGQEPDYESSTARLCKECLYKAFDIAAKGECK